MVGPAVAAWSKRSEIPRIGEVVGLLASREGCEYWCEREVLKMASKGVTAADFGNTASSQKFTRTREANPTGPDIGGGSGATPAAAAFLSELRQQMLPKAPTMPAATPSAHTAASRLPSVRHDSATESEVQAFAPPRQGSGKEYLSKAERKKVKKQQQQQQSQPSIAKKRKKSTSSRAE